MAQGLQDLLELPGPGAGVAPQNPQGLAEGLGGTGPQLRLALAHPATYTVPQMLHIKALAEKATLEDGRHVQVVGMIAEPAAGALADFLYPQGGTARDDYYSALCTKRSRGLARVWALTLDGRIAATIGAYAIREGKAYLACGCTAPALRGRGAGGRLAALFAGGLAAEGLDVSLLCRGERLAFYTRLGFAQAGGLGCYVPGETGKENYAGTLF